MWLCILECEKHLANTFARVTICHTYSWSKPIHILYYHYLHLRPTFGSFVSVNARISYFTMWTVHWVTHSLITFSIFHYFFLKVYFCFFFNFILEQIWQFSPVLWTLIILFEGVSDKQYVDDFIKSWICSLFLSEIW